MVQENYHHGDLRKSLLLAGLSVLDKEGAAALGVRRLAREVGVAHSAPANHFPNKKALWTALALCCFEALLAELENLEPKPSKQTLEQIAAVTIRFGLKYPHRFRLMFRWDDLDQEDETLKQKLASAYQFLLNAMKALPLKQSSSLETHAISFWSMVHGYTLMRIEGTLIPGVDELNSLPREQAIVKLWTESVSC